MRLITITLLITTALVSHSTAYGQTQSANNDRIPIETLLLEARGEGLDGMTAVGEVIRQRAIIAKKGYSSVCLKPLQFSAWNDRGEALRRLKRFTGEDWQLASKAWALSEDSTLTKGADHYLNPKAVKRIPAWARLDKRTAVIGRHWFYKLERG